MSDDDFNFDVDDEFSESDYDDFMFRRVSISHNSDDGNSFLSILSDDDEEAEETDYSNELQKALERLNRAVDKLGEIKTKPQNNYLCSICYVCPREYAYLPCGHFCVCESCMKKTSCSNKPSICPLCKQPADECHRIYL